MTGRKKHILFYIGTMGGGGAEHVLLALLKHLNREKYKLSIVLNRPEGKLFDEIPDDVRIIDRSSAYRSRWSVFERYFGLANIIRKEQADLAVSFLTGANRSLMRARFWTGKRVGFIVREGNNPVHIQKNATGVLQKWLSKWEVRYFYPKADRVIVASSGIGDHFTEHWGLNPTLFSVIPNMISFEKIRRSEKKEELTAQKRKGVRTLVAAGRLVKQKGYPDMLEVMAKVKKELPAELIILGDGPRKEDILHGIRRLSLEEDVRLAGFVKNPWSYMKAADLYLSTSRYEGFHLTIAEAMACGTPPVVTDCDYGPREIIRHGTDGFLIPVGDVEGMAGQVIHLLKDEEERNRIAENARKRAKDFDVQNIVEQYENVFDQVLIDRGKL